MGKGRKGVTVGREMLMRETVRERKMEKGIYGGRKEERGTK